MNGSVSRTISVMLGLVEYLGISLVFQLTLASNSTRKVSKREHNEY